MKRFLFLFLLLSLGCEDQLPVLDTYQTVVIREGKHMAVPVWVDIGDRPGLFVEYVFDESAQYDHQSLDQKDWNKLGGVSFNLTTNHENSAMVSWRWGIGCECIHLGAYYHKDGERIIGEVDDEEILGTIKPWEPVETYINIMKIPDSPDAVGITIITPTDTIYHELEFTIELDLPTRLINPWFGGNLSAPHDVFIYRKLIE